MGQSIKFQLMRSVKSGKNRWLFIGFLIYIIGFCVFLGFKESSYDKSQQNILNNEAQGYGNILKVVSGTLNDMEESDERYAQLRNENDFYQSQYTSSRLMITALEKRIQGSEESLEDSLNFIKAKEIKYEGIKKAYGNGAIDDDYLESEGLSIEEVERDVNYINHLVAEKIPIPINPYSLSVESFLRNFFTGANMIIVLAFILLFVIDSYVIELRDDCYKTIYTSPLKRNQLLLSKILASYIGCCSHIPRAFVRIHGGFINLWMGESIKYSSNE